MQASKNYELFCKRKINLHCHTLIFFMFIGSFTQTCLGLLEAFSWYPCFFFGPIQPLANESSKSRCLEFCPGVISLSLSRAISEIALSLTFCPVPSEFEIAGLDCNKFDKVFLEILSKHACLKRKLFIKNYPSYVSRAMRKAIMKRSSLEKKYLKKEPRPATLLKKSLKHRRFSLNFAKFYEHLFCRTPLGDCFCILENN